MPGCGGLAWSGVLGGTGALALVVDDPDGTHRYRFTVCALSGPTGLSDGADLSQALRAVESRATGQGRLVGTYRRRG